MPTFATLCYLCIRDRVLLLRKAPGLFGEGKWNAPGGKLLTGESPEMGAIREMREETGLRVHNLKFHGILNFYLGVDEKLDQTVFVFSSKMSLGKMKSSREGGLQWFSSRKIPYREMWEDDSLWLPLLFAGERFIGDFFFTEEYNKLKEHKINLVR